MSNTKDIKDYLHLFIGADVMTDQGKGILTQVHIDGDFIVQLESFEDGDIISDITLILRPLSSITKEEMKGLWSLIFRRPFHENGQIRRIDKRTSDAEPRWVLMSGLERLGIEMNGTIWADCDLSHHKFNQHEVTRYLLSLHFDLFDLINSGLALEKQQEVPNE